MADAVPSPPPIVIVGHALPAPVGDRTLSTATIGRAELDRAPTDQLDQVLKSIAGLQLFRRSDARSGHPTSQGVTLRALGGNASSRALLLLDGVPQADPFGGWINWPAYDPASLQAVRVTRGGGSVAFGPGALAGVIELDSRVAGERPTGELTVGSRSMLEARAAERVDVAGGGLSLSGRYGRGDGFIPVVASQRGPADRAAPYREASLRARYVRAIAPDLEAQLSASGFVDRRERGLDFTANRTRGADAALRLVGRGEWQWSALGYGQWRGLSSSFASVDARRSRATRVSLQDDVPSDAIGGSFELRPPLGEATELRIGGDGRIARGHSHEYYSYAAGKPTRVRDSGGETATVGLFGEGSRTIGPLTLSAGARIDRWRIGDGLLDENLLASGTVLTAARYRARSGWLPTARAGASLSIAPAVSLRAAAYLGWRLPTLNELFRPFRAGPDATAANPALEPERSKGAEIGAQIGDSTAGATVTLFDNRLEQPIVNATLGAGPGIFPGVGFVAAGGKYRRRRNGPAIDVRGVELDGWAKRGPWGLRASYSYADPVTAGGLRPAQTARHNASATASWDLGSTSLAITARYVGAQYEDDLNRQRLAPATTVDAFAAAGLGKRLQIVLRGENLFDARVEAGVTSDGIVERATPRTLSVGLRLVD